MQSRPVQFGDWSTAGKAELFQEDFQAGYVKNLLRLQQEVIKLPDSEEHYDIYLAKKLYPVLLPGVELLAREIDRLTNKESQGKSTNQINIPIKLFMINL